MNKTNRELLAEVAELVHVLWMFDVGGRTYTSCVCQLYASASANLLNGNKKTKFEAVGKLESLRSEVRAKLQSDGKDVVKIGRVWGLKCFPVASVIVAVVA